MCGVVGVIALGSRPVALETILAMSERVAHRGPDDQGAVLLGGSGERVGGARVGLGHRRLAILDLSSRGHQPMEFDGVSIAFNGEVYNYIELREELAGRGHVFHSATDTEVVLHAYREWGDACVERFNGIFSFVLWDEPADRLVAARDHLGVKPLYFHRSRDFLFLASEIRPILTALGSARKANDSRVFDFFVTGRLDHAEETLFSGIERLPAGSRLIGVDGEIRVERYWAPTLCEERFGRVFKDNVEEFRELFLDAVRIQMRSDVPVACCLSGGLDSSSVVAVASQRAGRGMSVFTARYQHRAMDEWEFARVVHAACDVRPIEVWVEAEDFIANIDRVVDAQEEPFGGPGVYAQWKVMRAIHDHGLKVVLDGQGGDELMAGYAKYFYFHLRDLWRSGRPAALASSVATAVVNGGPQLLNVSGARRYLPGARWLNRNRQELLNPDFFGLWKDRPVVHPAGTVGEQQIVDLTRFGLPVLLRYEDKNSMASSVESRVPFLDRRLVDFCLSIPVEHMLRGGQAKRLLRAALSDFLPAKIRRRRSKLGFGGHWHLWVRQLEPRLNDWLEERHLPVDRYLSRAAVRDQLRRHDPEIFKAFILDRWLEVFGVK